MWRRHNSHYVAWHPSVGDGMQMQDSLELSSQSNISVCMFCMGCCCCCMRGVIGSWDVMLSSIFAQLYGEQVWAGAGGGGGGAAGEG